MESSPLMQLLELMDNPIIVIAMILAVLLIRFIWVRYFMPQPSAAAQAHASRKAREAAQAEDTPSAKPKKNITLEVIDTVLIALILVFGLVRPFLLQTFFIPSESMVPTLLVSDKLIANKFIYRFHAPQHGDIVVFEPPVEATIGNDANLMFRVWLEEHPQEQIRAWDPEIAEMRNQRLAELPPIPQKQQDYIKRVIGVPGDHIRIVAGKGVSVNGRVITEPYLQEGASSVSFPVPSPDPGAFPQRQDYASPDEYSHAVSNWIVTWYRSAHLYQDRIAPYVENNGEFVVPQDAIFVMGDNRDNSFDSRFWGLVPLDQVKGRAVSTFWPLTRLKLL